MSRKRTVKDLAVICLGVAAISGALAIPVVYLAYLFFVGDTLIIMNSNDHPIQVVAVRANGQDIDDDRQLPRTILADSHFQGALWMGHRTMSSVVELTVEMRSPTTAKTPRMNCQYKRAGTMSCVAEIWIGLEGLHCGYCDPPF